MAGSLFTLTAAAQNRDLEYRESELDKQDDRLAVRANIESEWHEFNNLDLRVLDESSDQNILDTDDRDGFAFTGGFIELGYRVEDRTRVVVAASHRGLWGNDQIGNINAFGGFFYFTAMYMEHHLPEDKATFRIGRQFYELGGLGGGRDYVLADVLDMVLVNVPLGDVAHLELMPAGIVGNSSALDNANFVSFLGQTGISTFGFRGDHRTIRTGGMLVLDGIDKLDLRGYGYYTDVGALGTGSDISFNGRLGNFVDNDYVANFGVRGNYQIGQLVPFAAVDVSTGIDRKELVARDVDTNGYAVQVGARLRPGRDGGFFGRASFYRASGPTYGADGLQASHGYVSMKARQVGGTITDRFMGWHPSSYVGMFGVSDEPDDINRISGTQVIHARAGIQKKGVRASVAWWLMQDTGSTELNLNALDDINPPTGYSRAEFAAQERAGRVLGNEVDLDIRGNVTNKLQVRLNAAYFLPGEYYDVQVARVAGEQLGFDGDAQTWAINLGTEVNF